jgi:hypothetical protein
MNWIPSTRPEVELRKLAELPSIACKIIRFGLSSLLPTIAQIQVEHIVQMSGVFWLSILYACV